MSCGRCNVGYNGQRYEIRFKDSAGTERVFGWTNEKGGTLLKVCKLMPGTSGHYVKDLQPVAEEKKLTRYNVIPKAVRKVRHEHKPIILHRTGGPTADERNVCSKCGDVIVRVSDVWISAPRQPLGD